MRILAVLLIAIFVLGTLAAYERFVDTLPRPESSHSEPTQATGKFLVEVTLSFNAEVDAFAASDEAAVVVRMAGRDILRSAEPVRAGELLRAIDVPNIVAGRNAFFVRAIPAESDRARPGAVRVKILRDGEVIAENSIWSEPGGVVAGEVIIDVSKSEIRSTKSETNPKHEEEM